MLSFACLLVCALRLGQACSPEGLADQPGPSDLVGKTYFSHAVVIGRVTSIYPTPRLSPQAYTVKMQVECVIKDIDGKITSRELNITEAGTIEGMCHSAEFMPGHGYIAFLREDHSQLYKPWESPAQNTEQNRALVMKTCGLQPTGRYCPSTPAGPCQRDTRGYSNDQVSHSHDHDMDHYHHADEDTGMGHSHSDHHKDGSYDHDHDHDHHHDEHDGHHDHDHHDHDHDHDHHDDEDSHFDHDHDHSEHHESNAAAIEASRGHRDIMTAVSVVSVVAGGVYLLQ